MKMKIEHIGIALLIIVFLLTAYMAEEAQKDIERICLRLSGFILSPQMIVSGVAQGIAFLPYTIGTGVDSLNQALVQSQSVSLDDSYRATYGVSLADQRVNRQTGQIHGKQIFGPDYRPKAMMEATSAFQRLLVSQGMSQTEAEHYLIVGRYTYTRMKWRNLLAFIRRLVSQISQTNTEHIVGNYTLTKTILIAVIYRYNVSGEIRVVPQNTGNMGWLSAYERGINGEVIDEVIDWTGLEYPILQQDKVVAMLMVIAAESVKSGRRSPGYWMAERRWIAGETSQIIAESSAKVKKAFRFFPADPTAD